ncbi:MAG TPA: hypothetical protein VLC93_12450, partial [Myxococcota bacterium]|nr:hypothetical protein [Myxococcota bacterium]
MGFVAALVALLASTEPVLCVDAEATMADDIVDAVRVRMEGRPIRVARCDSEQGSATWRVTVRSAGDDVLA